MIDIATWRARIGLYRVRAGPSGRRAKVLLLLPSDGAADWSLLSTITVEHVVQPASVGQLVETAGEWY